MRKAGEINVYICEKCRQPTVTQHQDDGVAPFTVTCDNGVGACQGQAWSCFYSPESIPTDDRKTPTWLWVTDPEQLTGPANRLKLQPTVAKQQAMLAKLPEPSPPSRPGRRKPAAVKARQLELF